MFTILVPTFGDLYLDSFAVWGSSPPYQLLTPQLSKILRVRVMYSYNSM